MKPVNKPIRFLFISLFVLMTGLINAQPARPKPAGPARPDVPRQRHLAMKANNYGDSIVLRWNVDQGAYWLAANKRGYILERLDYTAPNVKPVRRRLTIAPIRPWSLDSMKQRLGRNDRYAAIAAQILHGKNNAQPPKGTIADFYQRYQEQQGQLLTAAMAAEFSAGAANALGLRWVDRAVDKKASRYVYRLWINNGPTPKSGDLTDTATVSVLPWRVDSLSAPKVARVVAGDSILKLHWYRYHTSGNFSGYYIERSTDGKLFNRLNEVPYVAARPDTENASRDQPISPQEVFYTDSVKVNYRKFYYRIIGINTFGDLSKPSTLLVGSGRDLTPPRPPIDIQKKVEDNRRIVLSWSLPNPAPDLKGFYIGQANELAGPYQPLMKTLLPASARTFINEKPVPYLGKYYVIAVVDTAGNVAYSTPITALIDDKVAPAAPKNLATKVDTNGIVTLRWPASKEPDVLGYKVYRSYQRDGEYYAQRTTGILADSMFTDTLPSRTLTKSAYYKLVAVDLSNNHSVFSEPVMVPIPDKVAPATPIIKSLTVDNRGIRLELIPSLSADVAEHTLYRREPGQDWKPLTKLSGNSTSTISYVDTTVAHQQTYEYSLIARDQNRRPSDRSFVVSGQYVNLTKFRIEPPTSLKAIYDPQLKGIRIEWKANPPVGNHRFILYRGLNNEAPTMYRSVAQATFFTDLNLPQSGTYTYAVQLVLADRKSVPSTPVQAIYKP